MLTRNAEIFTVFGLIRLPEGRVLQKGAGRGAVFPGTLIGSKIIKKSGFSG